MSNVRCKIEDLDTVIGNILEDYVDDFQLLTKHAVHKVAQIAQKEVQAGSPVGKYTKHKGRYKKGWAVKDENVNRFRVSAIVHNRTDYQLAHLLEKGHVLKRGGRTLGRIPAQVHIKPAEERAIKNMEEAIVKIAEGRTY